MRSPFQGCLEQSQVLGINSSLRCYDHLVNSFMGGSPNHDDARPRIARDDRRRSVIPDSGSCFGSSTPGFLITKILLSLVLPSAELLGFPLRVSGKSSGVSCAISGASRHVL